MINAKDSKKIQIHSPKETSFYVRLHNIWPLKPRIIIIHSTYVQNPDLSLEINVKDADLNNFSDNDAITLVKRQKSLRVKTYHAKWIVTPLAGSLNEPEPRILIEHTILADGRGDVPKWLANHLTLKSIWKSMKNIRRQLPQKKWQLQFIEGIKEPITPD